MPKPRLGCIEKMQNFNNLFFHFSCSFCLSFINLLLAQFSDTVRKKVPNKDYGCRKFALRSFFLSKPHYREKVLADHENMLYINFAALKTMFVVFLDKRCSRNLLTSLKERY